QAPGPSNELPCAPGARNSPASLHPGVSHLRPVPSYRPWNFVCFTPIRMGMDKPDGNPQTCPMAGTLQSEIESLLTSAFAPSRLEVINDSAKHHGHAGDDG